MKKLVSLIVVIVFISLLTGCSQIRETFLEELSKAENELEEMEIVENELEEEEIVEEEIIEEIIYDELPAGKRSELIQALEQFSSNLLTTPSFTVFAKADSTTMFPNFGISSYFTTDLECDFNNLYVFYEVKKGGYETLDIGFMNIRDDKIVEYTLDRDGSTKETIISEDTSVDSVYSALSDYGILGTDTMDYIGNVVKVSNNKFTAEVTYNHLDQFMGSDFKDTFKDFENVDFNALRIFVSYTFSADYKSYVMNIKFNIKGRKEGVVLDYTLDMNQTLTITEIEHRSIADLGFRIPVSETIENIQFDASTSVGMNFKIYATKDNWVRYYLEKGFYETAISRYNLEGIQIYNEDMEAQYSAYPFEVIETGYYYVNLQSGRDELFNFFIFNLGINDISIETISGIEEGSINGYSEGEKDYNRIIIPSTDKKYILLMNVDFTNSTLTKNDIEFRASKSRLNSTSYCNWDLECSFYVDDTDDLVISIWTDEAIGSYVLNYRFIEVIPTTQNMYDAIDISNYSADNPFQLGRGVDHAYFMITIEEYGKYQINTRAIYGMNGYIEYDIYTLDGLKLELGGRNGDYIEPGSYYVDMYYDYGNRFDVIYPTVVSRDK